MSNKFFIALVLSILIVGGTRFYTKYTETTADEDNPIARHTAHKALLYIREGCSYCTMAKNLLSEKQIKFESIEIGNNQDLFTKLSNQTGQKSVPYIFIDGRFIGGYQDLKNLSDSGKL